MYTLSTGFNCGAFTVTFQQKKTGDASYGALDTSVFTVDQATETFTKPSSVVLSEVDTYDLVYTVALDDYPTIVSAQSSPFVYTIADPCATPTLTNPG